METIFFFLLYKWDLDLEDSNPHLLHDTLIHNYAPPYNVWLQKVNCSENILWTKLDTRTDRHGKSRIPPIFVTRVVVRQRKHDHITPTLRQLHLLPVHDYSPKAALSLLPFHLQKPATLFLWAHFATHSILFSLIGERVISWCSWVQEL